MDTVKSSLISAVGYDEGSETMRVKFKRGATYEYESVPLEVWQQFQAAPSQGAFFVNNIKGNFQGKRLGD